MEKTALIVRHRAKPGQRDKVREAWEEWVRPRVEENPDHEAYYFCYDDDDEDVVRVFQVFSSPEAVEKFMDPSWYPTYLSKVSQFISEAPTLHAATPKWIKVGAKAKGT